MEKKQINIDIGARVRSARNKQGFSREELAEKIDVSALFLSYIESGLKGASLTTFQKLCRALYVSADYLLFGDEQAEDSGITNMLQTIDKKYLPLAEEQIQVFIKTIEEAQK